MNNRGNGWLLPLAYAHAKGLTFEEMRQNFLDSEIGQELYKNGDCILVWINEGDLLIQNMNIEIYNMNVDMGTENNPDEGI